MDDVDMNLLHIGASCIVFFAMLMDIPGERAGMRKRTGKTVGDKGKKWPMEDKRKEETSS